MSLPASGLPHAALWSSRSSAWLTRSRNCALPSNASDKAPIQAGQRPRPRITHGRTQAARFLGYERVVWPNNFNRLQGCYERRAAEWLTLPPGVRRVDRYGWHRLTRPSRRVMSGRTFVNMPYRLATTRSDYSDLASGFVLRSAPHYPAFPVRLAQELFLRCAAHVGVQGPLTLWDPCCGSGYLAVVTGLLNRPRLGRLMCSDVSPDAVALAARNLALLTAAGLAERERELLGRAAQHGKEDYAERAAAARRLAAELQEAGGDLPGAAVVADVFDPVALAALPAADLVITDVPYGEQTSWQGSAPAAQDALGALLRSLCQVLPEHAVVALCARQRRISFDPPVLALERFRIGHRAAFVGRVAEMRAAL